MRIKKFDQQTQELENAHFLALNHITQEKNQLINQLQSTYEMNLSGNNEEQNELL